LCGFGFERERLGVYRFSEREDCTSEEKVKESDAGWKEEHLGR
jgi:hypothetical protein